MPEAASASESALRMNELHQGLPAEPVVVPQHTLDLKLGELIEVRAAAEIMSTLDADGKLEGLPFMPEMLAFCGRRLCVSSRADNTCALGQPRRIEATVHLEQLRCDGSAHRGCEASCLILWKEAWLRRVPESDDGHSFVSPLRMDADSKSSYRALSDFAQKPNNALICQATELASASCPAPVGSPPSYFGGLVRDFISGNRGFDDLRKLIIYFRGKALLYAFMLWARAPWNADRYRKTPERPLGLLPGELVQVRGPLEILRTLDRKGCNRGMEFKPEMFQFCGRKYQVIMNMQRRIDERSGELKGFRSPCIVLEGVYCDGQRSFCKRSNYHYWREIWLNRV
jgi:hypothetical protein